MMSNRGLLGAWKRKWEKKTRNRTNQRPGRTPLFFAKQPECRVVCAIAAESRQVNKVKGSGLRPMSLRLFRMEQLITLIHDIVVDLKPRPIYQLAGFTHREPLPAVDFTHANNIISGYA